ncbi:hypothetical protein YYC_02857 [Plasmodium yoelii 17X]|uniref:Uncharacterized protein n=2 Tax=Plasmodium yoelii TaxID=5861 RepID=Q7RBH4_PLAYO|nr:hypothetical protein [Plasmodium yoelii yoelii]ETB59339.1 hypothetical protein YYC_02857 [Plasmodium yoelii 17X]
MKSKYTTKRGIIYYGRGIYHIPHKIFAIYESYYTYHNFHYKKLANQWIC